jgi:hypothetical protein
MKVNRFELDYRGVQCDVHCIINLTVLKLISQHNKRGW